MADEIWVLLKHVEYDEGYSCQPYYATNSYDGISNKINKIQNANRSYEMRPIVSHGENGEPSTWVIGPDENEGFFGHDTISFTAHKIKLDVRQ